MIISRLIFCRISDAYGNVENATLFNNMHQMLLLVQRIGEFMRHT